MRATAACGSRPSVTTRCHDSSNPVRSRHFIRPSGRVLKTGPPPVRAEIKGLLPVLFRSEELADWKAGVAQVSLDVPDRQFAEVK